MSVFAPRDGESAPLPHELCRLLPAWPALLQRVHAARPCRAPTRASTLAALVSNAAAGVRAWMELRVPLALVAWGDPRGFPRPVGPVSPLFMIRDKIVGFHDATRLATLHNSAMPGPLTPSQSQRHGVCTAMMIRPYKPRDSARSALLTAVRNRRSGLSYYLIYPLILSILSYLILSSSCTKIVFRFGLP